MSTRIMALCWPLQMPPVPKAVLISLADQANDQGVCWPSIASIIERTCFGRTAVIEALKWLESSRAVSVDRAASRTNRYTITVDAFTGALSGSTQAIGIAPAPFNERSARRTVRQTDGPPDELDGPPDGPLPVRHADRSVRQADPNRKEPSYEPSQKKDKTPAALTVADLVADGLSEETAAEYIAHRRRKRATLTARAWRDIRAEIGKAGMTLEDGVAKAMSRGWTGFEASWITSPARASSKAEQQRAWLEGLTGRRSGDVADIIDV